MYEFVKGQGWVDTPENQATTKDGVSCLIVDRQPQPGEYYCYKNSAHTVATHTLEGLQAFLSKLNRRDLVPARQNTKPMYQGIWTILVIGE